jgi:hypothetical protein
MLPNKEALFWLIDLLARETLWASVKRKYDASAPVFSLAVTLNTTESSHLHLFPSLRSPEPTCL